MKAGLRIAAAFAGLALLLVISHLTILATGGYSSPHAILTIALAVAAAVGAAVISSAWGSRRYTLAICIAVAVAASEVYGLMNTLERLVAAREAAQKPLQDIHASRERAAAQVAAAQKRRVEMTTTRRLDDASAAKRTADAAAISKSAEPGCAKNCRELLQGQVNAAAAEVGAARAALEADQRAAEAAVETARAALAAIKLPPSASPLADRLGLSAWAYDLMTAGLGSAAANVLAFFLLAFSAHGAQAAQPTQAEQPSLELAPESARHPTDIIEAKAVVLPSIEMQPAAPTEAVVVDPGQGMRQHAARYAVERLHAAEKAVTKLTDIHADYGAWCDRHGFTRLEPAQFGTVLAELFRNTRVRLEQRRGHPVAVGVGLHGMPADQVVLGLPAQKRRARVALGMAS